MTKNQIKMAAFCTVTELLKPYIPELTPQKLINAIEGQFGLERWATLPDCVRAVFEAVEVEENNGKNMPITPKYDTLRMSVLRQLKRSGAKVLIACNSTFFSVSDIADAMAAEYLGFDFSQYMTMFKKIGCRETFLHRAPRQREKNYKGEKRGGLQGER